ncbi:Conserved_hypothetical protein [Hexamita inflata]|uniref:Uncharacterized protein n=1 Tax=Hexamita inflata TaxID=28002 RepID=A0AA86PTN4_9EUKA|nr:Conserved hypothetical protein [Hexamita inflata]
MPSQESIEYIPQQLYAETTTVNLECKINREPLKKLSKSTLTAPQQPQQLLRVQRVHYSIKEDIKRRKVFAFPSKPQTTALAQKQILYDQRPRTPQWRSKSISNQQQEQLADTMTDFQLKGKIVNRVTKEEVTTPKVQIVSKAEPVLKITKTTAFRAKSAPKMQISVRQPQFVPYASKSSHRSPGMKVIAVNYVNDEHQQQLLDSVVEIYSHQNPISEDLQREFFAQTKRRAVSSLNLTQTDPDDCKIQSIDFKKNGQEITRNINLYKQAENVANMIMSKYYSGSRRTQIIGVQMCRQHASFYLNQQFKSTLFPDPFAFCQFLKMLFQIHEHHQCVHFLSSQLNQTSAREKLVKKSIKNVFAELDLTMKELEQFKKIEYLTYFQIITYLKIKPEVTKNAHFLLVNVISSVANETIYPKMLEQLINFSTNQILLNMQQATANFSEKNEATLKSEQYQVFTSNLNQNLQNYVRKPDYEREITLLDYMLDNTFQYQFDKRNYTLNNQFFTHSQQYLQTYTSQAFTLFLQHFREKLFHFFKQTDIYPNLEYFQDLQFLLFLVVNELKSYCLRCATEHVVVSVFQGIVVQNCEAFFSCYQLLVQLVYTLSQTQIINNYLHSLNESIRAHKRKMHYKFLLQVGNEIMLINKFLTTNGLQIEKQKMLKANDDLGLNGLPQIYKYWTEDMNNTQLKCFIYQFIARSVISAANSEIWSGIVKQMVDVETRQQVHAFLNIQGWEELETAYDKATIENEF